MPGVAMNGKRVGFEFWPDCDWILGQVAKTGLGPDEIIAFEIGQAKLKDLLYTELRVPEHCYDPGTVEAFSKSRPDTARRMREQESRWQKERHERYEKVVAKVNEGGKVGTLWGIDLVAVWEDKADIVVREGGRS